MRFIGTQGNLLQGVVSVSSLAGRNPQLPILQNILLETRDGVLHLTCTDLEVGAHVIVAGKAEADGSCTVPARQLLECLQQLPATNPVKLEVKKRGLSVVTQGFSAQLPVTDVDDFPLLPTPTTNTGIVLNGRQLCQAFSHTLFAAARDEARPEIYGLLVEGKDEEIRVAATDSFRLAEYIVPLQKGEAFKFLLPVNATQEIIRLFGDMDKVQLFAEKNYVALEGEGVNLSTRLIDGNYPDYQQIIPKSYTTQGTVDKDELLRALKMLSVFIPRESRRMELSVIPDKSSVKLHVEGGERGEGEVVIDFDGQGAAVDVLCNIQYLMEGVQHIVSDRCELGLGGVSDPMMVCPHKSSVRHLYVVMPIQV